jgi:hypothetical protein
MVLRHVAVCCIVLCCVVLHGVIIAQHYVALGILCYEALRCRLYAALHAVRGKRYAVRCTLRFTLS